MNKLVIGRRGLIAAGIGGAGVAGLSVLRAPEAFAAPGGMQNVQMLLPTGDTTGYTDTYNLYQLLNGNPSGVVTSTLSNPGAPPAGTQVPYTAVVLGAGKFYLGYGYGSASTPTRVPVVLSAGYQSIIGMGPSTTVCYVGSSFPSAPLPSPAGSLNAPFYGVIQITGNGATTDPITGCDITISSLRLAGQSSKSITDNPAASGIQISKSTRVLLENITFEYINGWMIDYEQPSQDAPISLDLHGIRGWFCAGGVKIDGNSQTVGASFIDCETAQLGVNSGPFAALDALCVHAAFDLTGANLNFSTSGNATYTDATTHKVTAVGHGFHLIGNVSNVWFSDINCGGYPYPEAGSGQCGLMIEDDASGNPSRITFSHGVFQTWDVGINLSGSGYDYTIDHCYIIQNQSNGGTIGVANAGMGGRALIESCHFGGNGQNNALQGSTGTVSWAVFDLHIRATSTSDPSDIAGTIRGCRFTSPIYATIGRPEYVQGSVYLDPSAAGLFRAQLNEFANSSASTNYVGNNASDILVQVTPTHLLPTP